VVDTNSINGFLKGERRGWKVKLRDQRHSLWLLDSAARSVGGSGSIGTSGVIRIHILRFVFIVI
jgi:hypothetical protein